MSTAGAAPDPAMTQAVMQRLFGAVKRDDANDIQGAIDAGINIQEIRGGGGFTLLHVAANEGATNVVKLLLSIGMDPLEKSDDGVTPLDVAKLSTIVELMESTTTPGGAGSSPDPQSTIDAFMKIMMKAVATDSTTDIQRAIDAGVGAAMRDWRGDRGETLLHIAAIAGSTNVVNLLLDDGHDPRVGFGTANHTPARMARLQNHTAIAERLEKAASEASQGHAPQTESSARAPAAPSKETVQTAAQLIVQAVRNNDVANIRMALDKGLNIQGIHGPNRMTLLHLAAEHGHDDMAKLLIEAGLDPLDETDDGLSAPMVAVMAGHAALGTFLLEEGKKLAERNVRALNERAASLRKTQEQAPAPAAPTEAPASPSGEPRALDYSERHLWGTPVDDLYGFWSPGQSRTLARLRKTFGGAKAEPEASATAAPQASAAPAPAAQPTTTFPPLTPAQERFKSAILNGDVEALREQGAGGFPVNDPVFAGSAALHVAAADGKTHVVRALLALGADLNAQDQQGNTALLYAIGNRRTETAIHLAQIDGIDVNHQTPTRYTALHAAVQANVPMVVPYLLAKGADTTLTNRDGKTPLQFAEAVQRDDIVLALRNAPAPAKAEPAAAAPVQAHPENDEEDGSEGGISQEQFEWHTALIAAIRDDDLAQVKALATEGTTFLYDDTGRGALHVACAAGNPAIVKHLLDVGADPDAVVTVRDDEYNALEIATAQGNQEIVALLRQAMGLEDSEENAEQDETPSAVAERARKASAACETGDLAGVRALVTGPGDPVLEMTNSDGASLLHAAVAGENADVVRFLVEQGIDLQTRMTQRIDDLDTDGPFTALDVARILRDKAAVAVLEEACDAAKGGKGIDGETPMVKAMRKPNGGLFVGVYNKFTGDGVHRTLAERLEKQVREQHEAQEQEQGDAPASSPTTEAEMDAMRAIGAAVEAGDTERLEQVIDGYPTGQQIFVGDGNTILHIAANRGNAANVLLLLAKGADPFHRNQRGQRAIDVVPDNFHGKHTALHLALAMGEEHRFPFPAMVPTFRDEAIERGVSFEDLQVLKAQNEALERSDRMEQDPYWTMNVLEPRRLDIARGAAKAMNYDVSMFDLKKSDTQLHFITLLVAAAEWLAKAGRQAVDNDRDFRETATVDQVAAHRVAFRRAVAGVQVRLAMHPYSFAISTQTPENQEMFSKLCNFIANVDRADTMSELEQHDFTAAISILMSSWDWSQVHLLAQARAVAKGEVPPHLTLDDFRRFHENFEALDSTKDGDNIYPRDANEDAYMTLSTMLGLLVQHKGAVRPLAVTDDLPDVEALRETKHWLSEIRAFREVYELTSASEVDPALMTSDIDFNEAMGFVAGGGVAILYEVFTFPGDEPMVMLFRGRIEEKHADWYAGVIKAANRSELKVGMMFVPIL
ncbi:TPA: ankyrin repeat domain-containing protein [Burkholderia vietnamiensis]|nr:ankyrin repeat domain-containing protein [Burkholderia vietnamiensis]